MEDKEYLKSLIDKFNSNQDDETLTKTEKILLSKILDSHKKTTDLMDKKTKIEKQISDEKKSVAKLEADINKEIIKSDTYVEALCALR